MPPRAKPATRVSSGAGMTAGLEIWNCAGQLILYDRSPDGRFAADVTTWNTPFDKKVVAGLNVTATKYCKDAA